MEPIQLKKMDITYNPPPLFIHSNGHRAKELTVLVALAIFSVISLGFFISQYIKKIQKNNELQKLHDHFQLTSQNLNELCKNLFEDMKNFGDVEGLTRMLNQIKSKHSVLKAKYKETKFKDQAFINELNSLAQEATDLRGLFEEQKNYMEQFQLTSQNLNESCENLFEDMKNFGDVEGLTRMLHQIKSKHSVLKAKYKETKFKDQAFINELNSLAQEATDLRGLFEEQKNYMEQFKPLGNEDENACLTLKDRVRESVNSNKENEIKSWGSSLATWIQQGNALRTLDFNVNFSGEDGVNATDGDGVSLEYINLLFKNLFDKNNHFLSYNHTSQPQVLNLIYLITLILKHISDKSNLKTGKCFSLAVFKAICECNSEEISLIRKNHAMRDEALTKSSSSYHRLCRRVIALDSESEKNTSSLMLDLLANKKNFSLYNDEMDGIVEETEYFTKYHNHTSVSDLKKQMSNEEYQLLIQSALTDHLTSKMDIALSNIYGIVAAWEASSKSTEQQKWAGESPIRKRILKDQLFIRGANSISKDIQGEYNRKKLCNQIQNLVLQKESPIYHIYHKRLQWMMYFLKVAATEKDLENFLIFATGSNSNPSEKITLCPAQENKPLLLVSQTCFNRVALNSIYIPETETPEQFFDCIRKSIDPDLRSFGFA